MSVPEQDRPGQSDLGGPAGPSETWAGDELDEVLSDPSSAGPLGQILAAAGAPAEAGPQVGEDAARSAFRVAFPPSPARASRVRLSMSRRLAAAGLASGLVLSGGAAAASAGALPGAAQQTAKHVMSKLGVSIPGPDEDAATHRPGPATPTPAPATTGDPYATAGDGEPSGTGNEVSGAARSTASAGVVKGAAVSGAASDGKSQAGQHGKPAGASTGKPTAKTPKPHAEKRRNGSHHPGKPGGAHRPQPKNGPHTQQHSAEDTQPPKGERH